MKIQWRRIVAAHMVSSDNKILFGRKRPNSGAVYPDCWHIPGGGVDAGETDEQAMRREILEETGLDTSQAKVILVDNKGSGESEKVLPSGEKVLVRMQFNIFKVEINHPAAKIPVTESDDLVGFEWFSIEQLSSIKLTPPAEVLFKRLGTDWLKFGACHD